MIKFHFLILLSIRSLSLNSLIIVALGTGLFFSTAILAQDPARFAKEVSGFVTEEAVAYDGDLVIFTGSSSVRGWTSLSADFPHDHVINRGFGGSQMSDLLAYLDELVIKHRPSVVFIYEGDNDIAAGESPEDVLTEAMQITDLLKAELPKIDIVFISAKPSISRWHLKPQFIKYNNALKEAAKMDNSLHFADVWTPMLYSDSSLNKTLYVEDGLHMNSRGYEIWAQSIEPLMRQFRAVD